jgi:hypothetical protein
MTIDISSIGGSATIHAMSGASAGMPPQQKMSNLFNQIDTSGSGSINQAQFDQAFQSFNPRRFSSNRERTRSFRRLIRTAPAAFRNRIS